MRFLRIFNTLIVLGLSGVATAQPVDPTPTTYVKQQDPRFLNAARFKSYTQGAEPIAPFMFQGATVFNDTTKLLRFYNGTDWVDVQSGSELWVFADSNIHPTTPDRRVQVGLATSVAAKGQFSITKSYGANAITGYFGTGAGGENHVVIEADTDNLGPETDNPVLDFWQDAAGNKAYIRFGGPLGHGHPENDFVIASDVIPGAFTASIIFGTNDGVSTKNRLEIDKNGLVMVASLTPSRPLLSDASKGLVSGLIDLASATHVTGNLPVTNLNSGTSASATTCWYGDATWKSCGSVGGAVTGSGTGTRVAFWTPVGASTVLTSNADLYWDNSNSRLGVGTAAPSVSLHVAKASGTSLAAHITSGTTDSQVLAFGVVAGVGYAVGKSADDKFQINRDSPLGTGTRLLTITNTGLAGIGTIDPPLTQLHVRKLSGSSVLTLENTGNGNTSGIDFMRERSSGTGVSGGSMFINSDTSSGNALLYIQAQTASAGPGTTSALTAANGVRIVLRGGSGILTIESGATQTVSLSATGAWTWANYTTNGGIFYADGSGVVSQAGAGTTTTVLHGGTGPAYSAVALGAGGDVSGTLPVANGGTSLATLTAHAVYVGNGTSAPIALAVGGANTFLAGVTTSDPTWRAVSLATADVTGDLPVTHLNSGTGASATTCWYGDGSWKSCGSVGGAVTGSGTTHGTAVWASSSTLTTTAVCSTGTYLRGVSTADPICSTLVLPNAATTNQIPYATSTNTWGTSSTFVFDGTFFGVGTASPAFQVHAVKDGGQVSIKADSFGATGTTNTPAMSLRAAGGSVASPTLTQSGDRLGIYLFEGLTNTTGPVFTVAGGVNGFAEATFTSTSAPGYVTISTTPSGSVSNAERMRVTSAGNVGIGNTPTVLFSVGSTELFQVANNGASLGIGTTSTTGVFHIKASTNSSINMDGDATGNPFIEFDQNGTRRAFIQYVNSNSSLSMSVGGTTRVVVIAGMQIGTPTGGDKGAGSINAVTLFGNGTAVTVPAYVFDLAYSGTSARAGRTAPPPGYRLFSLEETEVYTRVHHDLPTIGRHNTDELGQRSNLLLATIEEAYLHIFSLNDRIKHLEMRIATLESSL